MKQAEDVSEQSGFRRLMIAVLAAVLVGTLVRLALAPNKIEKSVRSRLEASTLRDNLTFEGATVSLADGWWPDLALVVSRVEWRPAPADAAGCGATAPLRARNVRIPLRFTSLIAGRATVGDVKIDDLTVDLDELKRDCSASGVIPKSQSSAAHKTPAAREQSEKPAGESGKSTADAVSTDAVATLRTELWSEDEQQKVASIIHGVRIARAEVFFEDRMKSVVLEDAMASWRGSALDVSTSLRFPPATVFGENLPTFSISGTANRNEMQAEIRADLSEGTLEGNAVFKPVLVKGAKELDAELNLAVVDLPLSVVTPLLSKSKILTGAFRPKFMWLDCRADVRGLFSRLFVENPVLLSSCEISGQVGRVTLSSATRLPNGAWKPFEVAAEKLDIARVFETFELQGPSGVFANFGKLSGKLLLNSADSAEASGKVEGAVIRFAGGDGTALQPLLIGDVNATLAKGRWKLDITKFVPEGGEAALRVSADVDETGRDARVDIHLDRLKLHPRVEKVIFTGPVSDITGAASFAVGYLPEASHATLTRLKADLSIRDIHGSEITSQEIKLEAQLAKAKGEIELGAKSNRIDVLRTGRLFRLLEPALFGAAGPGDQEAERLALSKVAIKGRFRDNGFQWQQAAAQAGSSLNLLSHGHIYRDHAIDSELEANYPLAARLKWSVSGTWLKPKFAAASSELGSLYVKAGLPRETVVGNVPPRLLGIPVPD